MAAVGKLLGAAGQLLRRLLLRVGRYRCRDGQTLRNKVRRVIRRWNRKRRKTTKAAGNRLARWACRITQGKEWRKGEAKGTELHKGGRAESSKAGRRRNGHELGMRCEEGGAKERGKQTGKGVRHERASERNEGAGAVEKGVSGRSNKKRSAQAKLGGALALFACTLFAGFEVHQERWESGWLGEGGGTAERHKKESEAGHVIFDLCSEKRHPREAEKWLWPAGCLADSDTWARLRKARRRAKGGWYIGVRVGEARKPGPYSVGGASGSGGGVPLHETMGGGASRNQVAWEAAGHGRWIHSSKAPDWKRARSQPLRKTTLRMSPSPEPSLR